MIAPSTYGLAVYNALAVKGQATLAEVVTFNAELDFPMSLEVAKSAVDRLIVLERVEEKAPGIFRARGPRGGIVRVRSRKGDGWYGWLVDAPNLGRRLLEEVLS